MARPPASPGPRGPSAADQDGAAERTAGGAREAGGGTRHVPAASPGSPRLVSALVLTNVLVLLILSGDGRHPEATCG